MNYTREQIEAAVKAKGYVYFDGTKDYDINIIGVRICTTRIKSNRIARFGIGNANGAECT